MDERSVAGSSNPGKMYTDIGGVARNVARNLSQLGAPALLCSRVGKDGAGREVMEEPFDTSLVSVSETCPTATYIAVLEPDGELAIGFDDFRIYDEMTAAVLAGALPRLRECGLWFVDANLTGEAIEWLAGQAGGIPVAVDAISVSKARRLRGVRGRVEYLFCNLAQAQVLGGGEFADAESAARGLLDAGVKCGVVSAGSRGAAVYSAGEVRMLDAFAATVRDVTGAGDALISGTLFGLSRGLDLFAAARLGLAAAAITVESGGSTSDALRIEALYARS